MSCFPPAFSGRASSEAYRTTAGPQPRCALTGLALRVGRRWWAQVQYIAPLKMHFGNVR
ncbi:hypothetical protein [Dictyobacter kobayashii]|uniref:hypothetical protein n=1 Tax=Dictyobacter kobayashii TaxID=2014872 RepID=UPI00138699B2|nr:hypothetical protein [Dictyobacter kobayashii]